MDFMDEVSVRPKRCLERASDEPDAIVRIFYDSRTRLVAQGVIRAPRVAQQKPNPGWVESDYESGGSRGDIGEQLAWLWPRMLGADLPPPRERGPIEPLPDFHREPRARR